MNASWLWIPIVLFAAAAQTARNAAQRSLIKTAGTLPATLVRFLYGLPFALLAFGTARQIAAVDLPAPSLDFLAWIALGAMSQLVATAFLLMAMAQRSFIVAVAYSKTELLQIALYSIVLLGEALSGATAIAIAMATAGVLLLSLKGAKSKAQADSWWSPAAALGLACGASFALSAVGYRGAALGLSQYPAWLVGTYSVAWAQAMQTVVLAGYLAIRDAEGLRKVIAQWRVSMLAGCTGAIASCAWLTAFAMRNAADVRTVGLVEVIYGYAVSRRMYKEHVTGRELAGIALVAGGIVVIGVAR
ncbi:MAG TPA: EamA/RhaT family transporter [Casimicrobiaceae bacterium]|nr:EamA/RhaT family transporter [Casimicrobiaceae bacterium]